MQNKNWNVNKADDKKCFCSGNHKVNELLSNWVMPPNLLECKCNGQYLCFDNHAIELKGEVSMV